MLPEARRLGCDRVEAASDAYRGGRFGPPFGARCLVLAFPFDQYGRERRLGMLRELRLERAAHPLPPAVPYARCGTPAISRPGIWRAISTH